MENLNKLISNPQLSILDNCDVKNRWEAWKNTGGTLNCDTTIGCGINTITFLGLMTRELGEKAQKQVHKIHGTPFQDIIDVVQFKNPSQDFFDYAYSLNTVHDVQLIFNDLQQNTLRFNGLDDANINNTSYAVEPYSSGYQFPPGSCTIIRFNRDVNYTRTHNLSGGHYCILSKDENGDIYIYDPQQVLVIKRNDEKIFKFCQRRGFTSMSLLFGVEIKSSLYFKHRKTKTHKKHTRTGSKSKSLINTIFRTTPKTKTKTKTRRHTTRMSKSNPFKSRRTSKRNLY